MLPAVAAVLGGLILLGAGPRLSGRLGALMGVAAGIWFAIGPDMSLLWHAGGEQGAAHGARGVQALEHLTMHTGLGAVMAALAAYATPGAVRRLASTEHTAAIPVETPLPRDTPRRRFGLRRRGEPAAD